MPLTTPPLPPSVLLAEVDDLLRTMPPIDSFESAGPEHFAWLGRASALVHRWDSVKAIARFDSFASQLGSGSYLQVPQGAQGVLTMLHQLRYDAFLQSPMPQSTNVPTGSVFQYFDEVRKAIELAKSDVFFVDPYLDADFVSRYLPAVAPGVSIRMLAREKITSLLPAAQLYQQQTSAAIAVRSASGFHDRYLIVDRTLCYQSGASFKDGAKKAPTTLTQIQDAFHAVLATYESLWSSATKHI
jgi:hypothetical protein